MFQLSIICDRRFSDYTCSKPSVRLAHSMSLVISRLDLERRGAIQAWKESTSECHVFLIRLQTIMVTTTCFRDFQQLLDFLVSLNTKWTHHPNTIYFFRLVNHSQTLFAFPYYTALYSPFYLLFMRLIHDFWCRAIISPSPVLIATFHAYYVPFILKRSICTKHIGNQWLDILLNSTPPWVKSRMVFLVTTSPFTKFSANF